ncbi:MAG: 50S ribosomal protein L18e [Desulfurococcales archaeon]|nr:50S ribosomal protein L18e [Desulfurococcales archaeon]
MTKRTGPTNLVLRKLISTLEKRGRETGKNVWFYIAELLEKPRRQKIAVNVSKINRYGDENHIIVVPGKLLGAGKVEKKVTVAAFSYSQKAKEKIEAAGGRVLTLAELLEERPEAREIKIIV